MPHAFLMLFLAFFSITGSAATLLVANKSESTLDFFKLPEAILISTVKTDLAPHEVAVSPNGKLALVSNYGTNELPGRSISVIDIPSARVLGTISVDQPIRPHGIEWIDNQRAVITAQGVESLLIVNALTLNVEHNIQSKRPKGHMVALSNTLKKAFVADMGSATVSIIDLAGREKTGELPTDKSPEGIALAANEKELWVSNRDANSLYVFDTQTLEKVAEIKLSGFPIRIEADDPRGLIYVTLPKDDALAVIDQSTKKEIRRVTFEVAPDHTRKTIFGSLLPDSSVPVGVLLSGDGETLFVAHANSHVITTYDANTLQLKTTIPTGTEPDGMGWSELDIKL